MFDEIKENGARFPNNKIIAFVINNCRNPSIGIDFRVFFIVSPYKTAPEYLRLYAPQP